MLKKKYGKRLKKILNSITRKFPELNIEAKFEIYHNITDLIDRANCNYEKRASVDVGNRRIRISDTIFRGYDLLLEAVLIHELVHLKYPEQRNEAEIMNITNKYLSKYSVKYHLLKRIYKY